MPDPLAGLKRAAARRVRAELTRARIDEEWRAAIREAREAGLSLRAIAAAAGVSNVRVLQVLREP